MILLLASFDKRSTYRKFDCFLIVENNKLEGLEDKDLVDKAVKNSWNQF